MTKSTSVTTALLWGLLALAMLPNAAQVYAQELKGITQEQSVIAQQLYAAHNQKVYPLEQKLAELRSELKYIQGDGRSKNATIYHKRRI